LSAQNLNSTTGIRLSEDSKKKDSYKASNNLLAYYLMTSIPLNKFKVDGGVRIEDNLQQLKSFDDFNNVPIQPSLHVVSVLPSANVSYNFTEKMLIRAAYGQTVNRPDFRELSKFGFYDFNYNFLFSGNPNLNVAKIQNVDLRWELYPSKGESINFGAFYKNFNNPIELAADANGGGLQLITFDNAKSALSYGLELEVKKSLAGLTNSKILDRINLLFNGSLIKSTVKQKDNALTVYQEKNRPMQGQAPYVINAGIFYATDNGWQLNMLYNVVGKSIFVVGNQFTASTYIMPRNVLDLTFSKRLSERFQLKGGVSDVLNQPVLLMQDANGDGKIKRNKESVVQKYRPGQVVSIGFSWKVNK
jgi:outer membrane receptor protein involved in Fe transport